MDRAEAEEVAVTAIELVTLHVWPAPWGDDYWTHTIDANSRHKVVSLILDEIWPVLDAAQAQQYACAWGDCMAPAVTGEDITARCDTHRGGAEERDLIEAWKRRAAALLRRAQAAEERRGLACPPTPAPAAS